MRSIGHIARLQRILANDADFVTPLDMLAELREDNKQLTANMRETHDLCDEHRDVATASLLLRPRRSKRQDFRRRLFLDTLNAADVDALADLAVRQGLAYNGFGFFPRDQQTSQALGALVKARGE